MKRQKHHTYNHGYTDGDAHSSSPSIPHHSPSQKSQKSQFKKTSHFKNPLDNTNIRSNMYIMIDESTQSCADVCRAPTRTATGSICVRKRRQNGCDSTAIHRAEPQRLHDLWRRPSSDRKSGARPRGSVPKRGRPSSRSATHQSCVAQRASRHSHLPLSRIEGGAHERSECAGDAQPRAGRPAWSRQTSTPVRHEREATAREKPQKLIQGRRRTPNGDPHRRTLFHARGLATRAVSGTWLLAV